MGSRLRERSPRSGRRPLTTFILLILASGLVLLLGTFLLAESAARRLALDDAERRGLAIAERLASPLVDADVRAGVPEAADALDRVMRGRMQDGSVARIKIWDESGRIIWADDAAIIGRTFELDPPVRALFDGDGVSAAVSELDAAENVSETGVSQLLEVYAGARDADGVPIVVETYLPTEPIEEYTSTIVGRFLPILIGSLLLFGAVVVMLARTLTAQVVSAERSAAESARRAVRASDLERRRIAVDLHNGVIQDLAGLGYVLPSLARTVRSGEDREISADRVEEAGRLVARNLDGLRRLSTDLYPPNLADDGLAEAVDRIVADRATAAGLRAEVEVADDLGVDDDTGRLIFGIVREGVQNVVKHARASTVRVRVENTAEGVTVQVADDGVGPGHGPGGGPGQTPDGHLGLRLLRDDVRDVGGRLVVAAGAAGGTVLEAHLPRG
ncbi:hypothetical protein GCM10027425_00490 [Alteromonas gracilis]